jgi:hypothetical protein
VSPGTALLPSTPEGAAGRAGPGGQGLSGIVDLTPEGGESLIYKAGDGFFIGFLSWIAPVLR